LGTDLTPQERIRTISIPPIGLEGLLGLPTEARGIVLFAHGSVSGRFSPRNNFAARAIVAKLRAITPLVVPSDLPFRDPEDRDLFPSGLRLAAGEPT